MAASDCEHYCRCSIRWDRRRSSSKSATRIMDCHRILHSVGRGVSAGNVSAGYVLSSPFIMHHLPPREVIVSIFLPIGPIGQGSFAIMQLGKVAEEIFPMTNAFGGATAGEIFYIIGIYAALIIWGYGLVWLFFALASITRNEFPFNMGWWGFTFPLGAYTVATTTLAKDIPSLLFKVLGMIFSVGT